MNRRFFLKVLAGTGIAAVIPAAVKAKHPLLNGEIGRIEGMRWIETVSPINQIKADMLKHAIPREMLGVTWQHRIRPESQGDTIIFRRPVPFTQRPYK